jgi:hypothetical protein
VEVVFAQVAVEDLGASEPLGETEEQGGVIDPLMGQGEGVGPGGVIPRAGESSHLTASLGPGERGSQLPHRELRRRSLSYREQGGIIVNNE